jgi:hypothetical protein
MWIECESFESCVTGDEGANDACRTGKVPVAPVVLAGSERQSDVVGGVSGEASSSRARLDQELADGDLDLTGRSIPPTSSSGLEAVRMVSCWVFSRRRSFKAGESCVSCAGAWRACGGSWIIISFAMEGDASGFCLSFRLNLAKVSRIFFIPHRFRDILAWRERKLQPGNQGSPDVTRADPGECLKRYRVI